MRGVLRTQSSFYNEVLSRKQLTTKKSLSSERKVKRNVGTSKFEYFEIPLGDLLRMSWGRLESTSQGRPLNVRSGLHLDVISRRPQDVRSPRQSFNVERGRPWDILGTNIYRLDVCSLLSRIPLSKTIETPAELIFQNKTNLKISKNELKELSKFATSRTFWLKVICVRKFTSFQLDHNWVPSLQIYLWVVIKEIGFRNFI